MVVRTLAVGLVHRADAAAEKGDFRGVAFWHYVALSMQGLRIMIPAGALLIRFFRSGSKLLKINSRVVRKRDDNRW